MRVSADQRYKLFVDGKPVARGPQRGDERHWHYDTLDLGPYLVAGENEIQALVWSFGRLAPMAQHTVRTAFVLEADDPESPLSTVGRWQVAPLPHWDFGMMHSHDPDYYIDVGPGEIFDATKMVIEEAPASASGRRDTEIGTTVRRLVKRMAALSGAEAIAILLDDPARGQLRGVPPGLGFEPSTIRDMGLDREGDYSQPRAIEPDEQETLGLVGKSGVLLPLPGSAHAIGAMLVISPPGREFDGATLGTLAGMALRLAEVLSSLQRYGESVWGADDLPRILEDLMSTPGRRVSQGGKRQLQLDFRTPHTICRAEERGAGDGGTPWMLVPATLPPQRYEVRDRVPTMRSWEDDAIREPSLFPRILEPGKPLLLDYEELICAYPRIVVGYEGAPKRGRAPTTVTLTYAEALWQADGGKGHRDEIVGKSMAGYQDRIVFDKDSIVFEPLWWRTWRYLQIDADARCVIESVEAVETGYPLEVESSFEADNPCVAPIWEVSVRTARRCAGETYFDCPYWEQLQYAGDSRIQALIGYYLGRDRRLQRNAVQQIGWSLMENGLTQSRYPSRQTQVIPPFSLWWLAMLYDQWLYDDGVVAADAAPLRRVLDAFESVHEDGERFWMFADWVPGWLAGVPPGGAASPVHGLTLALAEEMVAAMTGESSPNRAIAREGRSEHEEALARLVKRLRGVDPDPWPAHLGESVARCTYYFSYYKHLAMAAADPGFDYMVHLEPWREMIECGLTTFAENPEPTRSDCHAWSAHPILGFFQIVAGVTSVAPGWQRALIRPNPGRLRRFDARIAHPLGDLGVRFEGENLEIESPVPFELVWKGRTALFEPGTHRV